MEIETILSRAGPDSKLILFSGGSGRLLYSPHYEPDIELIEFDHLDELYEYLDQVEARANEHPLKSVMDDLLDSTSHYILPVRPTAKTEPHRATPRGLK